VTELFQDLLNSLIRHNQNLTHAWFFSLGHVKKVSGIASGVNIFSSITLPSDFPSMVEMRIPNRSVDLP
jgi:hypothetical protein